MMAITTNNSINVKPVRLRTIEEFMTHFFLLPKWERFSARINKFNAMEELWIRV